MATGRVRTPVQIVLNTLISTREPSRQRVPQLLRPLTTEAVRPSPASSIATAPSQIGSQLPIASIVSASAGAESSTKPSLHIPGPYQPPANPFIQQVECALRAFPSLEPTRIISYPSTHLLLPLRKDILHRAVIFEGDSKRYGIANTKWRSEVAGSGRKVRPQKGTGRARLGDRKSPSLNGGGVAFGPKPRDFSTELPQKVYDLAFRTALSHRYRQGELIVTDGNIDLILDGSEAQQNKEHLADLLRKLLDWNDLRGTTFVTSGPRTGLIAALSATGPNYPVRFLQSKDVEVKSLLEGRRLIIERNALTGIFKRHEDDVVPHLRLNSLSKDHDMY